MKIITHRDYGGFYLSKYAIEKLGEKYATFDYDEIRTNENIIALIEKEGSKKIFGDDDAYAIVELPNNVTDWEINDYDGFETITYVLDGKIYHI